MFRIFKLREPDRRVDEGFVYVITRVSDVVPTVKTHVNADEAKPYKLNGLTGLQLKESTQHFLET